MKTLKIAGIIIATLFLLLYASSLYIRIKAHHLEVRKAMSECAASGEKATSCAQFFSPMRINHWDIGL